MMGHQGSSYSWKTGQYWELDITYLARRPSVKRVIPPASEAEDGHSELARLEGPSLRRQDETGGEGVLERWRLAAPPLWCGVVCGMINFAAFSFHNSFHETPTSGDSAMPATFAGPCLTD